MGMIVLLMKFHGSGIDPIPVWKNGCSQKKIKRQEWTMFSLRWYIIAYNNFILFW